MSSIFVIGCGAVGIPLAASLARSRKDVVAVRTRDPGFPMQLLNYRVEVRGETSEIPIPTVGLDSLQGEESVIVISTKGHTNAMVADRLKDAGMRGPLVIMQNGMGVEKPFIDAGFKEVYRCVLYVVSEGDAENGFRFHPIKPSPIGIVSGSEEGFGACFETLDTSGFPLHREPDIRREVWGKTIVNSVFNSICPLMEADNGLFARNEQAKELAWELIQESASLARKQGIDLNAEALMERVLQISGNSTQAISTLQDLRRGRETEIDFINLELARIGASMEPPVPLPKTECLGKLIALKSVLGRCGSSS